MRRFLHRLPAVGGVLLFALFSAAALVFASSFEAASPRVANTTGPQPATLGTYPDTSLLLSTNTTVVPDAAPANTTSINVSTSISFMGTLTGDPATGVVRVTDAHPAGTYTVTVKAFNGGSPTATRTFTLTVTTPVTCSPVSFARTNFPVGALPVSVAVGDFNGDGKQDLAVANHGIGPPHPQAGSVWILLGDRAGNFSATNFAYGAVGNPDSVAVGDFNGDGKQDVALVGDTLPGSVLILLGDGAGNIGAPTSYAAGTFAIAVGDFNGDGKQDIATTGGAAWILLGDGAGSFTAPTTFPTGSYPFSIAVGDFNSDGKQDLATANYDSNNVSILLGDGAGNFSAPVNFSVGTAPHSVATGDFNGDGKQDLAVANSNSNNVSILLGNGAGNFSPPTNFAAGGEGHLTTIAVGDFDGDGQQDLAVARLDSNNLSTLLGDGTGNFSAPTIWAAGTWDLVVGDFNGDGKQDLASSFTSILLRTCAQTPAPTPTATATATFTPTLTATPSSTPAPTMTPCDPGVVFAQLFDVVTAPALPAGWTATNALGLPPLWLTSTTTPHTPPNDAFIDDPASVSDKRLDSPNIAISSASASVSFRNFYNLESTFDGGVLEVSSPNINGGTFTDITNAAVGGSFAAGGYNTTINTAFMSPIAGRMAWSGNAGGYINSVAYLGPNVAGQTIKLRFRMASDNSGSATGWRVDTVFVLDNPCPNATPTATATATATIPPTPTPTATPTTPQCTLTEGFENIATLIPNGWVRQNNSQPEGPAGWFQGNPYENFGAQSGSPASSIVANFLDGSGLATISNWLLTPPVVLQNGAKFSFWTTTVPVSLFFPDIFPDRLQVRMSTNGTSQDVGSTATSVGDFATLLLDINPTYTTTGYPVGWTNYLVTLSGIPSPVQGRLAFRYFVENGGPSGANSNHIGIDTVAYYCNGKNPTPTPATPTPTPQVSPTPGTPVSSVAGTILICSNPLPNVRVNVTGAVSRSDLSDGSGNYWHRFLPYARTFTVTPNKAPVVPGANGIGTTDVIALQRHYLTIFLIPPGCRLTAADVNADSVINTVDVIAVQRFFLSLTTGTANVGKYQFTPASRTYTGNGTNWTGENYDTVLVGDVVAPFVP